MPTNYFYPQAELDYHDRGSLNPYDIEKLLHEFIEDEQIKGNTRLLIITGKGRIVRPLVRTLLTRHPEVKEFASGSYHNGQDGAFEVIIKN